MAHIYSDITLNGQLLEESVFNERHNELMSVEYLSSSEESR
jgi:hypothetical protein